MADFNPEINDLITVNEDNSELLPALSIEISEIVTIIDAEEISLLAIEISESITIIEDIATLGILNIDISESIIISESEELSWRVESFDSITVSDIEDESVPALYLLIYDSITVIESISFLIQKLYLSKSDAITVSEDITTLGRLYKSIFNSIHVVDIEDKLDIIHIWKYDSIKSIDRFIKAPVDPDFAVPYTIASVHTMLTSSQRSAGTAYSDSFKVKSTIMVRFHIDVTAISGMPTLIVTPQVSPDNTTWYDETAIDTISQPDKYTDTLKWPGAYVRLKYVIAGTATPKVTFSAKMVKHMPVVREPVFI